MNHSSNLRDAAISIFRAGVDAVRGQQLIRDNIRFDEHSLLLGDIEIDRAFVDRLIVVGAGKASGAMAAGIIEGLGREFEMVGHVNIPERCLPDEFDPNDSPVTLLPARPIGINEPTPRVVQGTRRILSLVRDAGKRDLVIVLISGGGSALLCLPVEGITLEDKLAVTRHLGRAGADIMQLNTVRKQLSAVKGGRLAAACENALMVTLVLSDVLGDPPDVIASGPTVTNETNAEDALKVLSQFDPDRTLPPSVYEHLAKTPPTVVRVRQNVFPPVVLGNNAVAVDAAGIRAEALGFNHVMRCATRCEGEAADVGDELAELTVAMLRRGSDSHPHDALITGGEPVVTQAGTESRGRGGRNQHLILAAYIRLLDLKLSDEQWARITLFSAGTDGEDGPTDAAGAWINGDVHRNAIELGLSPQTYLNRCDAYAFFEAAGGLFKTGPTGTNVCDLRVALLRR